GGATSAHSGCVAPAPGAAVASLTTAIVPPIPSAAPSAPAITAAPPAPSAGSDQGDRPLFLRCHRVHPCHRQIGIRQQRQRDVTVPCLPAPHLVLVQPHFPFGPLEPALDRPAGPGNPRQFRHHGAFGREHPVVRNLLRGAERASGEYALCPALRRV